MFRYFWFLIPINRPIPINEVGLSIHSVFNVPSHVTLLARGIGKWYEQMQIIMQNRISTWLDIQSAYIWQFKSVEISYYLVFKIA